MSLPKIGAPATRALATIGVTQLEDLTQYRAEDLLVLHGFGPRALRILTDALHADGLALRPR
ncbi:MAG: DNA-binding protein [Actinobacteria bacterium]|nr:DNA-binding protein [Actinomycetota bacterium]